MPNLDHQTDEELVLQLRTGSHTAFAEIYKRYTLVLIGHAYKKLDSYEDAKEIVQDVFAKIWADHETIPVVHNVGGWLYILVRNKVLKHIEHKQVVHRYETSFRDFVQQDNYLTDMLLREKEMKALIDKEIEQLPPKMRKVLLLSRRELLSNRAIAEELDISENTVKNHLKAALKILRTRLGSLLTLLV